MALTILEQQLSDQLARAAEKNDKLATELAYTKDQLALSQARVSALEGQVKLHNDAKSVRQSGDALEAKASTNRYSLAGSSAAKTQQSNTQESGPAPTPGNAAPAA